MVDAYERLISVQGTVDLRQQDLQSPGLAEQRKRGHGGARPQDTQELLQNPRGRTAPNVPAVGAERRQRGALDLEPEAAGELDLDADIRGLVPEYDKGVAISTRQLLTHRAGIPHYEQLQLRTRVEYDDPHPWADQIVALNMFVESDLVLPPGRGYHYSTPGYALLGAVIERAGDDTYAEQVIERICRPLGMSSMRPDYVWEDIPHRAAAYQSFGERALQTAPDDISWKLAAGGWISTVADMGRFAAGLMGPDLLDDETKEMMWSPPSNTGSGYAMGITVRDYRGQKMLTHGGGQIGATTFLLCSPESGYGVAIACNTEGIGNLPDLSLRLMILLIESKL